MGPKQINRTFLFIKINVVIECYDLLRNKFPFSKSNYPSTMPNQVNKDHIKRDQKVHGNNNSI